MRSFSLSRRNTASRQSEEIMASTSSPPHHVASARARDSPTVSSSASSPITPTFSTRGHARWPSSSSSLVSSPESPLTTAAKTALHDLVEDPEEREEYPSGTSWVAPDEPLCICDTPFCEHRQMPPSKSGGSSLATPEWTPGDDYFSDGKLPVERSSKRRRSGEISAESIASRLSRRFPSMSRGWQGHRSSASISTPPSGAPPSRTSSLRLPSFRSSTTTSTITGVRTPADSPVSPSWAAFEQHVPNPQRTASKSRTKPMDIRVPTPDEDPIDRQEFVSTPLLPPMLADHFNRSDEDMQSPLQSPSIAPPSATASVLGTPKSTPVYAGMLTPPLSTKASTSSLTRGKSGQVVPSTSEIPPLAISEENDPWAIRLGHANFHIYPEPYMPARRDVQSCKRLRDDWESARVAYMRQAAWISEHYGRTSQIFKLTEQKWAAIDDQWRANHEKANADADVSLQSPHFQPLAETQPVSSMPALTDLHQPSKFPTIDEADIVGPMVQYAKPQRPATTSRKPALLKLFTDPASLLGVRPHFGLRR